ncbi:MAG: DUF3592 domain-containing protein [Pirellulales bacterium]
MPITLQELGEFLKAPAPREVPKSIRRQQLKGGLGCFPVLFGGFFAAFGSVFLVIFFPWRIVQELALDLGRPAVIDGTVTLSEETSMSQGGGKHRKGTPIHRIRYRFQPPGKLPSQGVCYRVGRGYPEGKKVRIEYQPYGPSFSRIEKCRVNPFGYGGGFVLLFPAIGLTMLGFSLRGRRRQMRLLRNGLFANGQIMAVDATNLTVNNQQRYKVSVAFDAQGLPQTAIYNAYGADVALAQRKLAASEAVGLLYDPARPSRVLLVDSLAAKAV